MSHERKVRKIENERKTDTKHPSSTYLSTSPDSCDSRSYDIENDDVECVDVEDADVDALADAFNRMLVKKEVKLIFHFKFFIS